MLDLLGQKKGDHSLQMQTLQRLHARVGKIGQLARTVDLAPLDRPAGGDLCRYHEFLERGWPFTRGFGADGVDGVALKPKDGGGRD